MIPPSIRAAGTVFVALALAGCSRSTGQAPPSSVEKPRVESDLSRTTITRQACKSLGIRSEPAETREVQDQLPLTGWIMARQGNEVTLTAPVAGYIRAASGAHPASGGRQPPVGSNPAASVPIPGLPVEAGDTLLTLEPVLTPVEAIQMAALKRTVDNEEAKALESLKVCEADFKRIADLHKQGLRGTQDLEQARARLKHCEEDLAAARDKKKLFHDADETFLKPMAIRAPRAGTVLVLHVSPGQFVTAVAPLVTIADLSQLWVRVPVPENDLGRIDRTQPASIVPVGQRPTLLAGKEKPAPPLTAQPVALVPLVDPIRHTADLIYELPPAGASPAARLTPRFAKDQMLTVFVPLGEKRKESVVPYAAVIYDAYAGAWIYLDRTTDGAPECVYERRRVELGPVIGAHVVVRPELKPGDRVVTAGAAALFSREFHKPPAVVDDD